MPHRPRQMLSPLQKTLVAAVTLSGCFAAQALFIDPQDLASAAQIEELTSQLAICPELATNVAGALDQHQGQLPNVLAEQFTQQAQHCERQRRHLPASARSQMAYTALAAVAHRGAQEPFSVDTRSEATPALSLRLTRTLGQ